MIGVSEFNVCSVRDLAVVIVESWEKPYFAAKPYLAAMLSLNDIHDPYGAETGVDIIGYFLANAQTWRGGTARAIKAELRRRLDRALN